MEDIGIVGLDGARPRPSDADGRASLERPAPDVLAPIPIGREVDRPTVSGKGRNPLG